MSCITLTVTPSAPAALAVERKGGAALAVAHESPLLTVTQEGGATLAVERKGGAVLQAEPLGGCRLAIGEVCTTSGGTIVVLAASDGPLRTRSGGYLLLDPADNPPED